MVEEPVSDSVSLTGVEETLMIPLWARAIATQRGGLIKDPAGGRSAHDARNNGGDRAGQVSGIVAGNRRWRRILPITAGSSMFAISARRAPHRGQASTSMPNLRRISSAQ